MSFIIYGIRAMGDREVRYIGQTAVGLDGRRRSHFNMAVVNSKAPRVSCLTKWLLAQRNEIEFFEIDTAETRTEANAKERRAVEFCAKLNHRLFNRWLVPRGKVAA